MIIGHVTGDTAVLLQLKSRGILMRDRLRTTVREQGVRLLGLVKLKVSGPVLKTRTGTLRRKLNVRFTESADELTASVGLKLAYGAAHEYGFDGVVTVREHLRTITQAFGRPLGGAVSVTVRTHSRHMKLPERSYLRSTLREEAPSLRDAMKRAIGGALA